MLHIKGVSLGANVVLSNASGIEYEEAQERVCFTNTDPWLEIKLSTLKSHSTIFGELRIKAKHNQPTFLNSKLYLNYGDGWAEENSIRFPLDSDVSVPIFIARPDLAEVRFDPDDRAGEITSLHIDYGSVTSAEQLALSIQRYSSQRSDWRNSIVMAVTLYEAWFVEGLPAKKPSLLGTKYLANHCLRYDADPGHDYGRWLEDFVNPGPDDSTRMASLIDKFILKPTFSFVIPIYNTPIDLLNACIQSMLAQVYSRFEIFIVDDCSTDVEVRRYMRDMSQKHANIKYAERSANGHISAASNTAMEMATGQFVVLVDHDDAIPDYALFVVAHYINKFPKAKILFSDEDKINSLGRRLDPYFKGSFDRFLMFGHNMVSHLGIYHRDIVKGVRGFRQGLEGSQDYDLFFRCYEQVSPDEVVHIPHVLYHWRILPGSTAMSADQKNYAFDAALNAINGHFERMKIPLRSVPGIAPGNAGVREVHSHDELVTIIIPTKDNLADLQPCVASLLQHEDMNKEIIIVNNRSVESETLVYLAAVEKNDNVRVLHFDEDFNYSKINNFAATRAKGDILCFLNNDTVLQSDRWLNRARCLLSIEGVGGVGARLLYEDDTLQHFGVYLGMGSHGVAGIPHHGISAQAYGYFSKARLMQSVSAVTAACLFVTKDLFDRIGGFDEDLAVAYNDVDLCLKIRAAGYEIVCDPEIRLIHKESRSRGYDITGAKAERLEREASKMRNRWGDVLKSDPYVSPNIALDRSDFAFARPPRVKLPWQL